MFEILFSQRHEQAIDPVYAIGGEAPVLGNFRPEHQQRVFFLQADSVSELRHDDPLQQSFHQLIACDADAVLMQHVSMDRIVDAGLEDIPGDHHVGRAAADVDASNSHFAAAGVGFFFHAGIDASRSGAADADSATTTSGWHGAQFLGRRFLTLIQAVGQLRLGSFEVAADRR